MNDNEYLAQKICELLDQGLPLVLASIVSQQGSTPRSSGTKMVIGADGKSYGTVGGSLLEATTIQESLAVLKSSQPKFINFTLASRDVNAMEMICGGNAVLLLDYVPATRENKALFHCWHDAVVRGDDFTFLTFVRGTDDAIAIVGHSLLFADGAVFGDSPLPKSDFEELVVEVRNTSLTSVLPINDLRVVADPIRKLKTVYCFGAGHVALPTAHIAALVGFRVVIVDDRAEFASAERFPSAVDIRVINDFNRALEGLDIDADSFIVILTRGHRYDRIVLSQALKTGAGYIGMISSREKRDAIYRALLAEGVAEEELARVHSPIGLAISARTPQEIAVSIVAELISVRVRQKT